MSVVVAEVASARISTAGESGTWVRFRANRAALVSAVLLVLLVLGAVCSGLLLSRGYADQSLATANRAPLSGSGLLGTDQLGRDILARVLFGVRLSLAAAGFAVAVQLLLGVTLGLIAGHHGGFIDAAIMRTVDVMLALPGLLIALVIGLSIKEQILNGTSWFAGALRWLDDVTSGLVPVLVVMALFFWVATARIVRGEVRRIERLDYVRAARAIGTPTITILRRHVLRNCTGPIVVSSSLAIPLAMVTEASLSLVGVGVSAPTPSLGLMIYEGTQQINSFPYQTLVPAVVFASVTVAFMFVGNGLRDAFDPTGSGR